MNRHIALIALLVLLTALVGCKDEGTPEAASHEADAPAAETVAATAAPAKSNLDFALTGLNGDSVALADHRGDVVIVDFWATWCGPCRMVMPHLQSIHDELADQGVRVIALSVDRKGPDVVKQFIARHGYTFPVAMANMELVKAYGGVPSIPTTFVMAPDGTISEKMVGVHSKADYLAAVERARAKAEGA